MEKLSKEQENVVKSAFEQVGLEKPSNDFLFNVMDAIEAQEHVTPPLISKKGWILIVSVFALSMSIFVFYPQNGSAIFDTIFSFRADFIENLFDGFQISKTMVMGISLLGLFLFQLPFLIKMTHKERAI